MNVVVDGNDRASGCSETMSLSSPTESVSAARVSMDSTWSIGGLRRNCVQQLRLQYDVTELRNRITKSETANDDLRKQLKKKEQELRHMEEQLRSINDKMHSIHKGEEENKEDILNLTRRCKELQRDKQELQSRLEQRDNLYQSLLNQCRAQDGTLAESSELRVLNKVLLQQVEDLKKAQQTGDSNDSITQRLRQELDKFKRQNQEQKQQISKLQRDNGSVADTLAKGLQNIQDLRSHNHELEKQRRSDAKRATLQLEQERLAHAKEVRDLKEDLLYKQHRLEEFEKTSLQQRALMEQLVQEQENRIQALETANNEYLQKIESEYNETVDRLQSKLEEKNNVIASLQEEVSSYMQEVMTLTTNLDESQVQNLLADDLNAEIINLEKERSVLKERLAAQESLLADMGTRLTKLELDKQSMETQQRIMLERHQREMSSQKNLTSSIQQGLRQSLSALQNESEATRQKLEHALDESASTITSLTEEAAKLREAMKQSQDAISKKDCTIHEFQSDLANAVEKLAIETNCKNEIRQQYEALETEIADLKQHFEEKVSAYCEAMKQQEEQVQMLERELQEQLATRLSLVNARDTLDDVLASRNEAIAEMATRMEEMEIEKESMVQQQRSLMECHQRELESHKQMAAAVERELRESLTALKNESDYTSRQLQQALDESQAFVATLNARVAAQQEEMSRLQDSQNAISTKDFAIHSLKAELATVTETLTIETSIKATLEQECEVLQTELVAVRERLEQEFDDLKAELAAVRERYEDDTSAYDEILDQQEQQVQILENQLRDLEAARNSILEERDNLNEIAALRNSSISDLTSRLADLELEKESASQQLATKNTTITEMTNRLTSCEMTLKQRDSAIAEMTSRAAKLELEIDSMSQQLAARNNMIAEMSNRATSLVLDKESISQQQRLECERHQRSMDSRNKLAAALEKGLRETLSNVKKDAETTCRDLQQALDSLEAQAASQQRTIESLQVELDLATEKLEIAESCKTAMEQEHSAMKDELHDLQQRYESEVAKYREASVVADRRVHTLENAIEEINKSHAGKELTMRRESDNLNAELGRLRTRLAVKEDEIRDLTLIDLRESEDVIESLTLKVMAAEDECKQSQSELHECKTMLQSREKELLSAQVERRQIVEQLQSSVTELQAGLATRENEFRAQAAKLQELEAAHASLLRKNALFAQRESSLREERGQLLAMEQDWSAVRAKLEKQEENLRSQVEILQVKLSEAEQNMKRGQQRLSDVEETLGDRTTVLTKVVELNKTLESDLVTVTSRAQWLDEAMTRLQEEMTAKEEEASRLKKDLLRKQDQFEETLHQERLQREMAEADLKALKSQLTNVRQDSKVICDLQKENVELLDKVKRQEAMIKRQIEKDKAMRNRPLCPSTNTRDTPNVKTATRDPMKGTPNLKASIRDPMTTPARGGSAMKPARGVTTSVKIARGSNRSMMSDVSSVSQEDLWESDSLNSLVAPTHRINANNNT